PVALAALQTITVVPAIVIPLAVPHSPEINAAQGILDTVTRGQGMGGADDDARVITGFVDLGGAPARFHGHCIQGRRTIGLAILVVIPGRQLRGQPDRKSTRLNSSHVKISYAVFCLKK